MRDIPVAARAYLLLVYALAAGAAGWFVLSFTGTIEPGDWVLTLGTASLAAAAQVFVVKRARSDHSDHLTPAPLFAAFLLVPRPLLLLVIILAHLPEWIFYRRKWFIQTFNIASWIVAAFVGKLVLALMTQQFRIQRGVELDPLAVLVSMPVFLGLQTLLLAWALKLARGHSLRESGLFAPGKLFVEFALLCAGWVFGVAWINNPLYGLAAAVPLVLIFQALHVPNLKEEAATDPKTGLANMRHFNAALAREVERAQRTGQPLSVLMCDLDYLRNINNTYGHQAGDVVLGGIADIIRRSIRAVDTAGRFGGEEFVILLTDTTSLGAQTTAERIRRALDRTRFPIGPGGEAVSATISIGIASFPTDAHTADALIREADLAVYQAKRDGRNRVVAAGRASRQLAAEWAREYLVPVGAPSDQQDPVRTRFWRFLTDVTRLPDADRQAVKQTSRAPGSEPSAATAAPPAGGLPTGASAPGEGRSALPWPLALFIGGVFVASLLALVPTLADGLPLEPAMWQPLALFAALTVLAEQLGIDVGSKRGKISVSAIPIIGASMLPGELGSLVAVAAFAVTAKVKARSPLHRFVFNFGMSLLAAVCSSWTFALFLDAPLQAVTFDRAVLPAAAAGLVYYAVNHLLLCCVRALAEGRLPWLIWRENYQWLAPHYTLFGVLGLVMASGYTAFGWSGALALLAPVGAMHLAMKQYMARTAVYVDELQLMNARLSDSYEATLQALTRALDTRDEETEEHSHRVRAYTELIARRMGVPEAEIAHIGLGALLHDVGKIGVPDAILLKPGQLTESERALMRRHPAIGYSMIAHIPFLASAASLVLHHHEAYDGSGYPAGLSGHTIPVGARIFAVADALDAMASDRPYRTARSLDAALKEIDRCGGTQFDPEVVASLLAIPADQLEACRRTVKTSSAILPVNLAGAAGRAGAGRLAAPSGQANVPLSPTLQPAVS